ERLVSWLLDSFRHRHKETLEQSPAGSGIDWQEALLDWDADRILSVLPLLTREQLRYNGAEDGIFCSVGLGACLNASSSSLGLPALGAHPLEPHFRSLGGPQQRLLRLLDPEGRLEVAKRRLSLCTVGMMVEREEDTMEVLAYAFPWLQALSVNQQTLHHPGARNKPAPWDAAKRYIYQQVLQSPLAEILRKFNADDMELYEHGRRLFESQKRAVPQVKSLPSTDLSSSVW
ncbi:unnamed protein product, partial [Symbiodinium sp. KB8]